jgi:hypothetical protein
LSNSSHAARKGRETLGADAGICTWSVPGPHRNFDSHSEPRLYTRTAEAIQRTLPRGCLSGLARKTDGTFRHRPKEKDSNCRRVHAMDAPEEDQEVKLQRASQDLLADLQQSLDPFLWKTTASGKRKIRRMVRVRETDRLVALVCLPISFALVGVDSSILVRAIPRESTTTRSPSSKPRSASRRCLPRLPYIEAFKQTTNIRPAANDQLKVNMQAYVYVL